MLTSHTSCIRKAATEEADRRVTLEEALHRREADTGQALTEAHTATHEAGRTVFLCVLLLQVTMDQVILGPGTRLVVQLVQPQLVLPQLVQVQLVLPWLVSHVTGVARLATTRGTALKNRQALVGRRGAGMMLVRRGLGELIRSRKEQDPPARLWALPNRRLLRQ